MKQKKVLVIVLEPANAALQEAVAEVTRRGLAPILFAPSYDSPVTQAPEGRRVMQPMDYLGAADIDRIYRAAFDWQKRLPSVKLNTGATLESWCHQPDAPTALWSWHFTLYPHVHLRIRLIETIRAALAAEKPWAFMLVGEDRAFPWQLSLIRRTIGIFAAKSREIQAPSASAIAGAAPPKRAPGLLRGIARAFRDRFQRERLLQAWGMASVRENGAWNAARVSKGGRLRVRSESDHWLELRHGESDLTLSAVVRFAPDGGGSVQLSLTNGSVRVDIAADPTSIRVAGMPPEAIVDGRVAVHVKIIGHRAKVTLDKAKTMRLRGLPAGPEREITLRHSHDESRAAIETTIGMSGAPARARIARSQLTAFRNVVRDALRIVSVVPRPPQPVVSDPEPQLPPAADPAAELKEKRAWAGSIAALDRWAASLPPTTGRRVVLVMRGRRGSYWFRSSRQGWMLWDLYIEGLPEALIAACRKRGWRLTIVYEGLAPEFDEERRKYADRFPDVVDEFATADIKGLFSAGRAASKTLYEKKLEALFESSAFRAGFSHAGVGFFDEIAPILRAEVANRSALFDLRYRGWLELLARLRPTALFGGRLESRPDINAAAHMLGVKSTTIKLGVGEEMLPSFIAFRSDGSFVHEVYPDLTLVWGEQQKRFLSARFPEFGGHIEASGRTRNDSFINENESVDLKAVRKRAGLKKKERIVIYGATSRTRYGLWPGGPWGTCCISPQTMEDSLRALSRAADRIPDMRIIFKPHPADSVDLINEVLKAIGDDRISLITDEAGFHNVEMLSVAEVFVSSVSSMFAEAVMCGCVPVNVWTPDVNFLYEANRNTIYKTISVPVDNLDDLTTTIVRLMSDSDYRKSEMGRIRGAVEAFFGSLDGRNAERAAELGLAVVDAASAHDHAFATANQASAPNRSDDARTHGCPLGREPP